MRITRKLPLMVTSFVLALAAAMLIEEAAIVVPGLERVETDLASRDLDRVVAAIGRDAAHLETFVRDWSEWDDTYRFAAGSDPGFVKRNFEYPTWENASLDAVAVYGPSGELAYSGRRDRAGRKIAAAGFFPARAPEGSPFFRASGDLTARSGLLKLGGSPYIAAICPILPSDGSGPPVGSLAMCRLIDDGYASALSEQTGVDSTLAPAEDSPARPAGPLAPGTQATGERGFARSEDGSAIEGSALLYGLDGAPALAARTRTDRTIISRGMATVRFFADTMLAIGLAFSILLGFVLSALVAKPIAAMRRCIASARDGYIDPMPSALASRRDEIGDLASAFSSLAEGLRDKRRELEEANASLERKVEERTFEMSLLAKVVESTSEAVVLTDLDGNIVKVNEAFCRSSGYSEEELLGRNPRILKSGRHDSAFYEDMWGSIAREGCWSGEIWDRRKDGEIYPKWLTINKVADSKGLHRNYVGVSADISEVKATEERLHRLAYYDPLTGLPNRALFRDRLEKAISRCARFGQRLAVIFIDLDRFKYVNDTLGHAVGDKLLVDVARRLSSRVREADSVCRLGGDEFTLVLERLRSSSDAAIVAEDILDDLKRPASLDGQTIFIEASLGIAVYPFDDLTAEGLTRKADAAMYRAKETGRNRYSFVSGETEAANKERLEMDLELRSAIERSELALHYQPIVDLGGRIVAAEALLRWKRDADGEPTLPSRSISLAEESGLILRLGEFALREACRTAASWNSAGREIRMSVNVSGRQFESAGLARLVADSLEGAGLPPRLLDIEITESILMADVASALRTMEELKSMGVGLSLDDFGTGYASLSYISRFPLDRIKIDRSFVKDAGLVNSASSLVGAIVAMAGSLGMKTIAEGVETELQRSFLAEKGCDELQGFLFSHAVPASSFEAMMSAAGGSRA